jgi:hypothetical protein
MRRSGTCTLDTSQDIARTADRTFLGALEEWLPKKEAAKAHNRISEAGNRSAA